MGGEELHKPEVGRETGEGKVDSKGSTATFWWEEVDQGAGSSRKEETQRRCLVPKGVSHKLQGEGLRGGRGEKHTQGGGCSSTGAPVAAIPGQLPLATIKCFLQPLAPLREAADC